jgi:hypothetical protein
MRSPAHEIGSRDFGAGMVVSRLPGGIWPAQKDPACGDASGAGDSRPAARDWPGAPIEPWRRGAGKIRQSRQKSLKRVGLNAV